LAGNGRSQSLVRLFGYQDSVSLDERGRFRLPDDLASAMHRELGRAERTAEPEMALAAYERLSFYFVPGTRQRIFLYPIPNIDLALERFENPPAELDPDVIRRARDYFYYRMRFVEADKQNRLVIPEGLRAHADIGEQVQQITLVAQDYWLALTRSEVAEARVAEELKAFEQVAADLLDPARRTPAPQRPPAREEAEQDRTEPGP
jgi:DNA-binding transcriptional regulator/RsmH inhibitor MraZ